MRRISRREVLQGLAFAAGAGVMGCQTRSECHGEAKARLGRSPSFVVIFCDDLGYGDLGCYGAEKIKTPHLDQMASEGMRFTDFYVCAAVCTPSRAGLLTGRYPIRSGLNFVLNPKSKDGIGDEEITLAQALKQQGYSTACIGKWHLGHLPAYLPTRHGFDRYFGIPYSNDMGNVAAGAPPLPLMRDETVIEQPVDQDTLTQRYTQEALTVIRETKDKPFFLYLAHSMPHLPLHASAAFRGKSAGGLYGDVIEEIDWSTGEILAELKRLGLDENTLVLFTSDNGPWLIKKQDGGSAGPLRNGKGTTFEGGVREPCIVRWPGKVSPGRVEKAPAITLDLFPTFVALINGDSNHLFAPRQSAQSVRSAGINGYCPHLLDGRDIRGVLLGTGKRADEEFFFYSGEKLEAHRSGPWKLKRPHPGPLFGEPQGHPLLLFNLEDDIGETTNLAEKRPDIVQRLESQLAAFEKGLGTVPKSKR